MISLDHRAAPQFLEVTLGLRLIALVRDLLAHFPLFRAVTLGRLLGAHREYFDAELGDAGRRQPPHGGGIQHLALLRRHVEGRAGDLVAHRDVPQRPRRRHALFAALEAGAQGLRFLLARLIGALRRPARHDEQDLPQLELKRGRRRLVVLLARLRGVENFLFADLQAALEFAADDRAPADVRLDARLQCRDVDAGFRQLIGKLLRVQPGVAGHAGERLIDVPVGDVDDVAPGDLQFELFVDQIVERLLAALLLVGGDFGQPHPVRDVEHRDRIAVDQSGDLGVGARVPARCDEQRQHHGAGEAGSKQ